jgi:hypothetical protein
VLVAVVIFFIRRNGIKLNRFIHNDLKKMSDTEAKMHYYVYGKKEGRIKNEKYISNEELKNGSHLYNHYYHVLLQNKKYNEYDFVVNDDYSLPKFLYHQITRID